MQMRDVVKNTGSYSKKKRRSNYSMYYGLVGLIVIITFVILSTTVFFKINTVSISGSSIYTADEIIAAAGINGGDNLIRTNMSKCASEIEKQLVYIEKAELKRSFPSSVTIHIEPAAETVNIQTENGCYLLSAGGKVLALNEQPYPDILTIYGADPAEDTAIGEKFSCSTENRTDILYQLIDVADNALDGKISSFDMTDHLNISSVYDNRIDIEFGAISEFDYKLKFADIILTTKIGPTTEGTLKLLSNGGASFIDKAGLEQNEQTFQNNMETSVQTENTDGSSQSDTSETNGETTKVVHFE